MAIFSDNKDSISQLNETQRFRRERELEDFFSSNDNLEQLLRVRFIKRQHRIRDGSEIIDILGLDYDNSPVIVELKLEEGDDAMLTQGDSYHLWLRLNKQDFSDLVEIKLGKEVKVNGDVPKIIFVAKSFSPRIQRLAEDRGYIELITYSTYEQGIFQLEGETLSARLLRGRLDTSGKDSLKTPKEHMSEFYTIDQHLNIITAEEVKDKFEKLLELIHALPEIQEDPRQTGVAYKVKNKRGKFLRLEFRPTWVQVLLKKPAYKSDSQKIVRDISSFKWGYDGQIKFTMDSDTDYVFEIIKEAYEQTQ